MTDKSNRDEHVAPDMGGRTEINGEGIGAEPIRLVIWDLDETFWKGTLTEGGIEYIQAHHDTVVKLAMRGIISSICSRNDHSVIEALLRERGIWDYFVFPSIDWSNKGPRIKKIVEDSQLRASTILFIDDNPMNKAEAARFVEGIRVSYPFIIDGLLDNPAFKGKEDKDLKRLSQYKILERRAQDILSVDDSNLFLRESGIKVFIEYNLEANLDRAIELINRTNQLNFTKIRLPEDLDLARQELRGLLSKMEIQTGLVRVTDRYGDYGYCGLYVQHRWLHDPKPNLLHFCFSCRTIGMDVETWVYRRLGSPDIEIKGEVLTDIKDLEKVIDWIQLETAVPLSDHSTHSPLEKLSRIFIRGGCESLAISHYFEVLTERLVSEFAFQRDGLEVRLDHSIMLDLALNKPDSEKTKSLLSLGYNQSDFDTAFLQSNNDERCAYILGFWAEANDSVFRHTTLGHQALVYLGHKIGIHPCDLTTTNAENLPEILKCSEIYNALAEVQINYVYDGCIDCESTKRNILNAARMTSAHSIIFLLGCTETTMGPDGSLNSFQPHINVNKSLRACAAESEKIVFIDIDKHINGIGDRLGPHNHYSREVYFRIFSDIRSQIDEWARLNIVYAKSV